MFSLSCAHRFIFIEGYSVIPTGGSKLFCRPPPAPPKRPDTEHSFSLKYKIFDTIFAETTRRLHGHACNGRLRGGEHTGRTRSQTGVRLFHAPRHSRLPDLIERLRSNQRADPNPIYPTNQRITCPGANQIAERAHTRISASPAHTRIGVSYPNRSLTSDQRFGSGRGFGWGLWLEISGFSGFRVSVSLS